MRTLDGWQRWWRRWCWCWCRLRAASARSPNSSSHKNAEKLAFGKNERCVCVKHICMYLAYRVPIHYIGVGRTLCKQAWNIFCTLPQDCAATCWQTAGMDNNVRVSPNHLDMVLKGALCRFNPHLASIYQQGNLWPFCSNSKTLVVLWDNDLYKKSFELRSG